MKLLLTGCLPEGIVTFKEVIDMVLLFGFFISMIGLGYFIYGKKIMDYHFLLSGVALMVYPYFISNLMLSIFIGLALAALPFITRRLF